jgi:hypothetical protein
MVRSGLRSSDKKILRLSDDKQNHAIMFLLRTGNNYDQAHLSLHVCPCTDDAAGGRGDDGPS